MKQQMEKLQETVNNLKNDAFESPSIDKLATAWAKAKLEYRRVHVNRKGAFKNDYADLDQIIQAVDKALASNGLVFTQQPRWTNGQVILHTRLLHASGQWMECRTPIPSELPQGAKMVGGNYNTNYGTTLSYQRRYAAMSFLGISISQDPDDDDGAAEIEEGQRENIAKGVTTHTIPAEKDMSDYQFITDQQHDDLQFELKGYDELARSILKGYRINSLRELPGKDYTAIVHTIRKKKFAYQKALETQENKDQ